MRKKPKRNKTKHFVKFDSIDSVIGSIRSIMRSVSVVDRPVCFNLLSREHGGRRSIRSIARSIDRVDRFDIFRVFGPRWRETKRRGGQDLWFVKVSALYDAWRPLKCENTETKNNGKFCQVRFGRFDNWFDSIDNPLSQHGWPPWLWL